MEQIIDVKDLSCQEDVRFIEKQYRKPVFFIVRDKIINCIHHGVGLFYKRYYFAHFKQIKKGQDFNHPIRIKRPVKHKFFIDRYLQIFHQRKFVVSNFYHSMKQIDLVENDLYFFTHIIDHILRFNTPQSFTLYTKSGDGYQLFAQKESTSLVGVYPQTEFLSYF